MSVNVMAFSQNHFMLSCVGLYYLACEDLERPLHKTDITIIAIFSSSSCLYNVSHMQAHTHALAPFLCTLTYKYLSILLAS